MKIKYWLGRVMSDRIGYAIIEVEPGEVADIEKMLILIDGDSVGHYGLKATLIGHEGFNVDVYAKKKQQNKFAMDQFGYPNTSTLQKMKRYYEVMVSRD